MEIVVSPLSRRRNGTWVSTVPVPFTFRGTYPARIAYPGALVHDRHCPQPPPNPSENRSGWVKTTAPSAYRTGPPLTAPERCAPIPPAAAPIELRVHSQEQIHDSGGPTKGDAGPLVKIPTS